MIIFRVLRRLITNSYLMFIKNLHKKDNFSKINVAASEGISTNSINTHSINTHRSNLISCSAHFRNYVKDSAIILIASVVNSCLDRFLTRLVKNLLQIMVSCLWVIPLNFKGTWLK